MKITRLTNVLRCSIPRRIAALACAASVVGCTQAPAQTPPQARQEAVSPSPATAAAPPPAAPDVEGPRIRIALKEIRIDDAAVPWAPAPIRDRLHKIDPLFDALRELRKPGLDPFAKGECVFEIEPDVPFMAAASAIMTGAFAGCPVAWVSTGSGWLKLRTPVPQPPGKPPAPESRVASRRQTALHIGPTAFDLTVFAVVPPASGAGREEVQEVAKRSVARGTSAARELGSVLAGACEQAPRPCPAGLWLTADTDALFGEAARALGAIVHVQNANPSAGGEAAEVLVSFRPRGSGPIDQLPPAIRLAGTQVSGRLAPEEIQRVVRSHFGAFRACYEEGLKRNPNLEGRVSVRFVIGNDGRVMQAGAPPETSPNPAGQASAPPMPDEKVVACVVGAFEKLVFPAPEAGIVSVVYPIQFSPGS
ncbi:AgmX/PglI C-terminal domain-containing protein [Polyangium sp. 6x1]|uniref:AgmX/PglI C-terminal domain-containing protein n=1 Tax=Polyangium sp. 6x1 TaxID=3042689 RepID=UPI0024828B34|nr:AgmX/PglI C-terminal domain-containing protein [Polyangium sp. 6x1]MDI1443585.1 AgmX/PglI C-terminal domain-containing protein [Polyangium sp. 6x1]